MDFFVFYAIACIFQNFFYHGYLFLLGERVGHKLKGKNSKVLMSKHSTSQRLPTIVHSSIEFILTVSLSLTLRTWLSLSLDNWRLAEWEAGGPGSSLSPKVGGGCLCFAGRGWFPLSLARERLRWKAAAPLPQRVPLPLLSPPGLFWAG